jgi:6-phosphofructokinase 1
MANVDTKKGVIGILTGGGDVPGLNPAIRGVTLRADRFHRPVGRTPA